MGASSSFGRLTPLLTPTLTHTNIHRGPTYLLSPVFQHQTRTVVKIRTSASGIVVLLVVVMAHDLRSFSHKCTRLSDSVTSTKGLIKPPGHLTLRFSCNFQRSNSNN